MAYFYPNRKIPPQNPNPGGTPPIDPKNDLKIDKNGPKIDKNDQKSIKMTKIHFLTSYD